MRSLIRWTMCVLLLAGGAVHAKVAVIATVPDLGALAKEVGGDDVSVNTLARSTQDPHFVDARPNLVLELSNADLLILNGIELESGWLPPLLTSSRNARIQPGQPGYLDASALITPKDVPQGKIDRSMGDIHPGGNPHYTLDPRNSVKVARGIAERLSALDPEKASAYAARLKAFETALNAKLEQWGAALAPFKGTDVVTYHKSWVYFVDWAGFDQVAFVEPKPGLPPSVGHVAKVLGVIKKNKVPLILQEQWYPASSSEQLARLSGATLLRVPGQTPEGKTYVQHVDEIVQRVVKALTRS